MKKIGIIAATILAVSFGAWTLLSSERGVSPETIGERFEIVPQELGSVVIVNRVELTSPGFVVLREVVNDRPGQIVEVSPYLSSGVHENVQIDLSDPLTGNEQIDISSSFPVSVDMVAVVYLDDGDEGFNPIRDMPQYVDGQLLARYVTTGEYAPNSVVPQGDVSSSETDEAAVVVTYTNEGFVPREVTISAGETVVFVNKSSRPMWVASNLHPAHTILPTFDQFSSTATGGSYRYTFDQVGEWTYHDHVNASQMGVVIVQ
ncbi:hypothetical protein CL652_03105 [bacterium]|nr:hypothetical protein [bacterium]|tara:strand:- start:53269 stop:54051 length:783 start_codon:yes stop_codon:yes gene_type:complete